MQELNNLPFHHIGFAVRSFADTRPAFEALGARLFHTASDKERNLDSELKRLKRMGFRPMGKILTSDVYGNEAAGVFLFSRELGVVELIQRCKHE